MNYDSILAIYNCFKDKIKYLPPENYLKKEIPEDVKKWYEEWKNTNTEENLENLEKNISLLKEDDNGELCIYYITLREYDSRVVTDRSEKEKRMMPLIDKSRDEMTKETIYNYLANILKNIDIPPFNAKKLDEQSVYECKATGNNSEQIKIDYDESKLTTCIKIKTNNKYLKVSMLPVISSTRYEGMVTIPKNKNKSNFNFFNIFRKKSKFELKHQETADFIAVTKDEINSICEAAGTVYAEEGVYIFEIKDNTFIINYFDQEAINIITTTNLNKKFELTDIIKLLREKKELTRTNFIEKLEETGLLPNAAFSIPCTSKELQILVNKAFITPRNLIEDLYKTK